MKGYKVFKPDFTCNDFQYKENSEFVFNDEIKMCSSGFHFCTKLSHCFSYYDFDPNNIVCEVEALGDILTHNDDSKICTNKIRIGKRLSWENVLQLANEGNRNTGYGNTGDWNTGDCNTGDCNTGDRNTGDRNTGDRNTGDRNTGDWNTGDCNTGDCNTGYGNTGDRNTGYGNTGDRNTGDCNTGDCNTGYGNTGDRNTGVFCTGNKTFDFFNKPSHLTEEDFKKSRAWRLLYNININIWIYESEMNEKEKEEHPYYKTAGGYLKSIEFKEAFKNAWHNWSQENKQAFIELPNFDADIFEQITGVKIKQDDEVKE